ncbi:galactokinase family protein [Hydrogenoanaerobacterium sp.]|uniref:galactokinase n=1 Tax=Hydrogenoanaerobacterium sp. TaxID=2953763 RepID=UPI0028989653|nr:galactokinase family protein [Hydrogenoanaerobacterium sp.]
MNTAKAIQALQAGGYNKLFSYLYVTDDAGADKQAARYERAVTEFEALYGKEKEVEFFSAPGRTEVGGNHTDHQHGRVLAGSVNLDVIAVCAKNDEGIIRIKSEGFAMDTVDLTDLTVQQKEINKAAALIRGIAARLNSLGYKIGGFDAYTTSNVLKGSGLSSSAAFEVLVGTVLNHIYNSGAISAVEIAQIGQYAENFFFGKPCGLMDQTASSVGGFVAIDFKDPTHPVVEKIDFDFAHSGYALCIVDTGGNHADLTGDYADIPAEMKQVAALCGKQVLREVDEKVFYENLPKIRKEAGDRAALRAIHFFGDNERAKEEADALKAGDFETFKKIIIASGQSSFNYLQNVFTTKNPSEQGISLALAISEKLLAGKGAWRVHGGGFAGTIQAFVPIGMLDEYKAEMEKVFGADTCHVLSIRPVGGIKVEDSILR